jgi:hypothetical protein
MVVVIKSIDTQTHKAALWGYSIIGIMFIHFAGDTAKFNMTFVLLRNTPLDVYFLTDVSGSLQFAISALRQGINDIGM